LQFRDEFLFYAVFRCLLAFNILYKTAICLKARQTEGKISVFSLLFSPSYTPLLSILDVLVINIGINLFQNLLCHGQSFRGKNRWKRLISQSTLNWKATYFQSGQRVGEIGKGQGRSNAAESLRARTQHCPIF
jgi:hypothetical protein